MFFPLLSGVGVWVRSLNGKFNYTSLSEFKILEIALISILQSVSKARIDQVDVVSSYDGNFRVEIQIAITLDDGNLDYNIYFIKI